MKFAPFPTFGGKQGIAGIQPIQVPQVRTSFPTARPPLRRAPEPTTKEKIAIQDDQVVNSFTDACIKISDKIDIKGYALVAWDEKGVPCISWSTGHIKNPISELMLPTFTQSVFQGILNKKLSTPEDLKDE